MFAGLSTKQLDVLVMRSEGRCELCSVVTSDLYAHHGPAGTVRALVCRGCHFLLRTRPAHSWNAPGGWEGVEVMPVKAAGALKRKAYSERQTRRMVGSA